MDFATTVQNAINTFQPSWLPREKDLSGLVVVIDPALGGQPATRRADDMSLMTGEHLYHLVRMGGGVPILTRADDQPMPGSSAGIEAALREYLTCTRGHLLVRIECGDLQKLGSSQDASIRSSLSIPFAEALAGKTKTKPEPLSILKVPATCVRFEPGAPTDAIHDRMRHREFAEQLYQGLSSFAQSHRDEIIQTRLAAFPSSGKSDCHSVPLYPNATNEQKRENFARLIWPAGSLPAEKADWFCQLYAKLRLSNRTIIYFEPRIAKDGDRLVLTGPTTDRQLAHGLIHALHVVGLDVDDHMRLLPNEETLGQRLFGACKVTMARTFVQPTEASGPQTQVLYGEPLFLLDRKDGHTLALASDGYWGWLRDEAVEPMTAEQFNAYNTTRLGVLLDDVTHAGSILHRGTRMPMQSSNGVTDRSTSLKKCSLTLPDGLTLDLPADQVRAVDGSPAAQERVEGALRMLYTPYVFGARSPIGLDCSGMVAYLGELTSLSPARDAAQQALSGRLVATRWHRTALTPGDQIYFIDEGGKIFHTGIAMTATHFIHCSPPEVQISSLHPGDRLYNPHWDHTFFIAKRP